MNSGHGNIQQHGQHPKNIFSQDALLSTFFKKIEAYLGNKV